MTGRDRRGGAGRSRISGSWARPRLPEEREDALAGIAFSEPTFRYAIVGFTLLFALIGLFTLLSSEGPQTPWETAVSCVFFGSTLPVGWVLSRVDHGAVWWAMDTRSPGVPEVFLLYADLGLTGTVITFQTASVALTGTALFAVIGAYASHFTLPCARNAHMIFSSAVVIVIGAWGVVGHEFDVAGGAARTLVLLLVVTGLVPLHNIYTRVVKQVILTAYTQAITDPLTGLANRRAFTQRARRMIATARQGVIVMLVDIDDFKTINDTRGHDYGDRTLSEVANAIRHMLGSDSVVARLGGDEFAIATPVAAEKAAIADELRVYVADAADVQVSVGRAVTAARPADEALALSTALSTADRNLYRDKKSGA